MRIRACCKNGTSLGFWLFDLAQSLNSGISTSHNYRRFRSGLRFGIDMRLDPLYGYL